MLLAGLTVVSGLVDAFSYLTLGQVFVANMTGNMVFLGFALAGIGHISVTSSLLAVLAFTIGAALGGRLATERPPHRGLLIATATAAQAVLVLVTAILAGTTDVEHPAVRLILIALLALAMGGQNAVVRRLAVPGPPTTVLTSTITGLIADAAPLPLRLRRALAVLTLVFGALMGGLLLRWVAVPAPLCLAVALLIACAAGSYLTARRPASATWR
jgi:uncharacterized membrane protein YoaK (UPF0700 family)